jgi:hypothetical protein
MSKLTREAFGAHKSTLWARYSVDEYGKFSNQMERLWEAIQSHTAECVAEAVAEAVKDRYEIGEEVQICVVEPSNGYIQSWKPAKVVATRTDIDESFTQSAEIGGYAVVRRPPVPRPMTDDELREAILMESGTNLSVRISRPTLKAMAVDLGISLTVEE